MRGISKYIFSIILLFPVSAFSQNGDYSRGLRIGFDLSSAAILAIEGEGVEAGFTADMNITDRYFAVADAGYINSIKTGPGYELSLNAIYLRAGGDYNFYQQNDDVIAAGVRYGFSTFSQKTGNLMVEQGYWGNYTGTVPEITLGSRWLEGVFSIKTELFSNVFIGWSLRGKVLLSKKDNPDMEEWHIPGYGLSNKSSTGGFNFYIYYRIPF